MCPNCLQEFEIDLLEQLGSIVVCPSCGGRFEVEMDYDEHYEQLWSLVEVTQCA